MSHYWSPAVHSLTPYVPGEQPSLHGLVKLNTNENPYGPSPRALQAIGAAVNDSLRLYPDPDARALRATIAEHHRLDAAQGFVGNGSDEVLAHACHALLDRGVPILFPDVTYSFYPVYCRLYGIAFETVPLSDSFEVRVEDYAGPCGGVLLANPNAPTGIALPLRDIERMLTLHRDQPVVIDEAYVDFGAASAVALIGDHPNLLVVQTLSKSRSLAGLRVGWALGHPHLIEALERVKGSFNSYPLDRLAQAGAAEAIRDVEYFDQTRRRVKHTRDALQESLRDLGFEVLPSRANFVFARHANFSASELVQGLRARSILVRRFEQPRIADFMRISIGTEAQCAALLEALADISRSA